MKPPKHVAAAPAVAPFLIPPGQGDTLRGPVGGPARILARAETTNGGFTAIDNEIPPDQGPPEHVHLREDEMYYVLEGAVRFKAAGSYFNASTGAFMFIPRGTRHCFRNMQNSPARLLVMFAPAGMERFFEGLAGVATADPATYRRIAHDASMEIVGPPMTAAEGDGD